MEDFNEWLARNYEQLAVKTGVISWSREYVVGPSRAGGAWQAWTVNTWVSPAVALVLIGTKMFRWFMFTVFGKKVILKIFILVKQGTLDRSSVPCCQSGCWPWPEHQRVTLLFSYWYIWPCGRKRDKFLSILLPYSPTRPCALLSGIGGVAFSSLGRSSGSLCKHQIAKNVSTQDQMKQTDPPQLSHNLQGKIFRAANPPTGSLPSAGKTWHKVRCM